MCNLYSIALFRVINRYVGNLPPMPGVFPDYPAPVIRNTEAGTEMLTMRWGMPPPPRTGGPPVTNIRNTVRGLIARAIEKFERLGILVNNAGIQFSPKGKSKARHFLQANSRLDCRKGVIPRTTRDLQSRVHSFPELMTKPFQKLLGGLDVCNQPPGIRAVLWISSVA